MRLYRLFILPEVIIPHPSPCYDGSEAFSDQCKSTVCPATTLQYMKRWGGEWRCNRERERKRGMKRGGCVQRRGSNRDFVCVKSIHPICSSCNSEGAAELEKSSTAVAQAKHCIAKLPSNNTSLSGKRLFSRLLFFSSSYRGISHRH